MSTSAEIVTAALRRLRIYDSHQDPTAVDMRDGQKALDLMLASWSAHGVNVDAAFPIPAMHERGIVALLAMNLADDYRKMPGPSVQKDAEDGWRALEAAYIVAPNATFDGGIIRTQGRLLPTD